MTEDSAHCTRLPPAVKSRQAADSFINHLETTRFMEDFSPSLLDSVDTKSRKKCRVIMRSIGSLWSTYSGDVLDFDMIAAN